MQLNPFDEILGLEEKFYNDGYRQGMVDGVATGRIEGRTFGLEKGFEKYVESGRLYGRSIIWANRIPSFHSTKYITRIERDHVGTSENPSHSPGDASLSSLTLPLLSENLRLSKNIKTLYALAESESLSTENLEEVVSDFDDRLKRAHAKVKIIERMANEVQGDLEGQGKVVNGNDGSIEDTNISKVRH
ncbi:hypothetical protein B7494_g194 [Chlorociboria aeruginascens]|nr:hypothetical protein B7494_g194 [Chlorociboria aeruginascens]